MKRVTLRNATKRHERTLPGAVNFYGLDCVARARRIKTATRPDDQAERKLINTNRLDEYVAEYLHDCLSTIFSDNWRQSRSSDSRMDEFSHEPLAGRATTTRSRPVLSNPSRKDSRISRRIRFRLTEFPATFLLTTIPILLASWSFSIARTRNSGELTRYFACRNTASNSRAFLRRCAPPDPEVTIVHGGDMRPSDVVKKSRIRPTAPFCLSPGVSSIPAGRPLSPFSREIRGYVYV